MPRFKPIEWRRVDDDPDSLFESDGIGGTYEIGEDARGVFLLYPLGSKIRQSFPTIEVAKEAAERDLHERLASMIE